MRNLLMTGGIVIFVLLGFLAVIGGFLGLEYLYFAFLLWTLILLSGILLSLCLDY